MSHWGRVSIDTADRLFSKFIRARDGEKCRNCGADGRLTQMECSHFFGRRMESVRYDPENADCLCRRCHGFFENEKGEGRDYRLWKLGQLGATRFAALEIRAHTTTKKDRNMSLLYVKALMADLKKSQPPVMGAKS